MSTAVPQSYVQLQATLTTFLQAESNELVEQVQNATSNTTPRQPGVADTKVIDSPGRFDEEPMKRADRLFKLRSYLGAVDQRNELEPTTTEYSSTLRLNMTLSTQMYHTPVMMETLYRCHNAGENEGFAGWRQFAREWEPRFVGLLRNVLSCRRKNDIPTQLPADEGLVHESQSSETVIDDIMTDVNVMRMEDGRVKACLIRESTRIASWMQMRKEILEITRTQQYADSNLVPMQIGVQPKSKGKGKDGKDAWNESSEKMKDDCRETGHARSQSRTRLKDLIDAEGQPVIAKSRSSSTAAVAPLADDYVTTFLVTVPHVKKKIVMCMCQDRDNDEVRCG